MAKYDEACVILEDYGTIGQKKNRKGVMCDVKLSKVSWYGKDETIDIRLWDGTHADKGISLNAEMMKTLRCLLDSIVF